jgi:hypothetical protein
MENNKEETIDEEEKDMLEVWQRQISKLFNRKLWKEGGQEWVDLMNRMSFNKLIGTSPSNYRMQAKLKTGKSYSSAKEALRDLEPIKARAKAFQEILLLEGKDIHEATKETLKHFNYKQTPRR